MLSTEDYITRNVISFIFGTDKKKVITNENKLNLLHTTMHQNSSTPDHVNMQGLQQQQQHHHQHQPNSNGPGSIQEAVPSLSNMTQNQQLSWTCELCGRMFATRDEWTIHAKSHLEVKIEFRYSLSSGTIDLFLFLFFYYVLGSSIDQTIRAVTQLQSVHRPKHLLVKNKNWIQQRTFPLAE